MESDPSISLLMNEGERLGGSVIFLVDEPTKVPSGCEAVVEITQSDVMDEVTGERQINFRYAEVGVNTARYTGRADIITEEEIMAKFARRLEPLQVRQSYGTDLPSGVLMMPMLKVNTEEELRQMTTEIWRKNATPEHADWLKGPLGLLSGGDVRSLKFAAHADGVHGLIAGSTGSGKSELLMTMILGLALNYDPSIVNFVLVDFKGGAAFEPFRNLPHVVDIVTNLKGSAVERMFAAITAELNRRQAINVATDSKHIVHYRQRRLHLPPYGKPVVHKGKEYHTAPYPHLFVFIDEFAEMIAENPEYKAQLNSITRLGRALGVTLILAAQRPTGVTDQMRANIKFRIALRVETREESSEVLRRPDAAYLPTGIPGRGYLQVGNENIELIQVAWTGNDYRGGRQVEKPNVVWHDRGKKKGDGGDEELPKVFEMMTDMLDSLSKVESLPQRKPWPDFLPTNYSLQSLVDVSYMNPVGLDFIVRGDLESLKAGEKAEDETRLPVPLNPSVGDWVLDKPVWQGASWGEQAMRAVVGLIDNPYNSEQMPLLIDLRRGHSVIFGASGWGKTTFLRTLLISLAVDLSPAEFHAYILDFGGRQLNVFRDMPHVGAIITPDEEERVTRFLRKMDSTLEERKRVLSDAGADDLYSYNENNPDNIFPAILVVIDNFAEFRESFDNLMPSLISLVRESRAYGIHFAISAELPNALSGKLYSLFTERLALRLSDPTEYTGIVGRGARHIDEIAGRGFVKVEKRALEFQIAMPLESVADEAQQMDETQKLALFIRRMEGHTLEMPERLRPQAINTLARRALLKDILPASDTGRRIRPIVGIDDLTLEPWELDIALLGPHTMVIGPPNSGKTTTLRSLVLATAHTYSPDDVMIVIADFQQRFYKYGGKHELGDLPHVVEVLSNVEQLELFVQKLQFETDQWSDPTFRKRSILVVIDNYATFSDDASNARTIMRPLSVMARERGTDGLHFIIGGATDILRASEDLRKQVQAPRFGIGMQAEPVGSLNGRLPRSLQQAELPQGRGFIVRAGRTTMLQVATPYADDEHIEADLDAWVEKIQQKYPNQQAEWAYVPPPEGEGETGGQEDKVKETVRTVVPSVSTVPTVADSEEKARQREELGLKMPANMDINALKQLLKEKTKMADIILNMMDEKALLSLAVSKGLIEQ
jgi:DNA segregation ATPase FtsK/SpoIIIE-like protein